MLDLRWRDIGKDAINLRVSKTGPRAVPLGEAARALIEALPGSRDPDVFLFPRHAEGKGLWVLTNCWRAACADAKLAGSACMTSGTRRPAKPSWRARIFRSLASCWGIGGTGPRQATLTLPMRTLSRRQRRWEQSSKVPCEVIY